MAVPRFLLSCSRRMHWYRFGLKMSARYRGSWPLATISLCSTVSLRSTICLQYIQYIQYIHILYSKLFSPFIQDGLLANVVTIFTYSTVLYIQYIVYIHGALARQMKMSWNRNASSQLCEQYITHVYVQYIYSIYSIYSMYIRCACAN